MTMVVVASIVNMVVVVAASMVKMVIASLLTHWANLSLDMKVGLLELSLLSYQFRHYLSPNDPFVTLHLHRHQHRCRVASLGNCNYVDAYALDIVWSKPTIEETQ